MKAIICSRKSKRVDVNERRFKHDGDWSPPEDFVDSLGQNYDGRRPPLQIMGSPIRILTAVPICDGHDSAINTINLEFIRHGIEVVYLGYHRSAGDIVRAAIQEDVRAIGISSYNGGHVEFFSEVVDRLRNHGTRDIGIFGGGGGTITPA